MILCLISKPFRMHTGLVIAILLAHVHGGTEVRANLTEAQADLCDGVLKAQLWLDLWFDFVTEEDDWIQVSGLLDPQSEFDARKKLEKIPLMMGCAYGLRMNWFLSSAVHVIGECNYLSRDQDGQTGDCWDKLKGCLERGSFTMLKVNRVLTHIHNIIGDDIDLDEFYQAMVPIRNFLTQRKVVEFTGVSQEGFDFGYLLNNVTLFLHRFMVSNCHPEYRPFDLEELMNEHERQNPTSYSYNFFVNKIDDYIGHINDHLTRLGFSYNSGQDETIFNPN